MKILTKNTIAKIIKNPNLLMIIIMTVLTINCTASNQYYNSNSLTEIENSARVEFNSIKQVHDVSIKGTKGMRIFVNMDMNYAEHQELKLIVDFFNADGQPLTSDSIAHANSRLFDQFTESFYLTNRFQTELNKTIFIPYPDIGIVPGKNELYFKVTVLCEDSEVAQSRMFGFSINK